MDVSLLLSSQLNSRDEITIIIIVIINFIVILINIVRIMIIFYCGNFNFFFVCSVSVY